MQQKTFVKRVLSLKVTRKLKCSSKARMGFNRRLGQLSGKGPENQAAGCAVNKGMQVAGSNGCNLVVLGPGQGRRATEPSPCPGIERGHSTLGENGKRGHTPQRKKIQGNIWSHEQ